jgi:hypothetical protein
MLSGSVLNAGYHLAKYIDRKGRIHKHLEENLCHAFSGGRIPYLPTSAELQNAGRPEDIARELFRRFLVFTETIASLDSRDAICLYMLNRPYPSDRVPHLDIGLIVKSARNEEAQAEESVKQLWSLVRHAYPTEPPFGYPLTNLLHGDLETWQKELDPKYVKTVAIFQKYWDSGEANTSADAFPHPYRAIPSLHTLVPLFAALKSSSERLLLTITLRPTELINRRHADHLLEIFQGMLRRSSEANEKKSKKFEEKEKSEDTVHPDQGLQEDALLLASDRLRAQLGVQVLEQLMRRADKLLAMTVNLVSGSNELPTSVTQAIRVALGGNDFTTKGNASLCFPASMTLFSREKEAKKLDAALDNLKWLEHDTDTKCDENNWKNIVTPNEAVTLFNLPMPSEFGQVPGIVAHSYPFYVPIEVTDDPREKLEEIKNGLKLGPIWNGGLVTDEVLKIPLSKLDQHILIAGRTGSGKTNTCLQLLCEMGKQNIPFLILDPLDKHDYRLLLGEPALQNTLRIYTPGASTSPLVFNPFVVPPRVTVRQHISQLMRCFLTAFIVGDPIPAIYRAALRKVYTLQGWDGEAQSGNQSISRPPTFREFFQTLELVAEERSRDYDQDIRGNIRQMTRLRIGSLLEDNAAILDISQDDHSKDVLDDLINAPTIIELGHIGNDEDKALIMAFLLACVLPRIQFRDDRKHIHILVIEEAHRLMRSGGSVNEFRGDATQQTRGDFSNLLAEVRGYKQGIIVVDQSPSELVPSVFSNTATHIMHHLRDPRSFEMMTSSFVLSPAQIAYTHRLEPYHAITETAAGTPVHIKPENVTDNLVRSLKERTDILFFDPVRKDTFVLDDAVVGIMKKHISNMPSTNRVSNFEELLIGKCSHCGRLGGKSKCENWLRVHVLVSSGSGMNELNKLDQKCSAIDDSLMQFLETFESNLSGFFQLATGSMNAENKMYYCVIAQRSEWLRTQDSKEQQSLAEKYEQVLIELDRLQGEWQEVSDPETQKGFFEEYEYALKWLDL